MNNGVFIASYFYIFLLVVVFVFSHSSIPALLFGINLKERRKEQSNLQTDIYIMHYIYFLCQLVNINNQEKTSSR